MGDKRGIEFSFTWIFAVVVGAVILFLAIYAATKIISTGDTGTTTATAKELGVLLNPLETGFQEGITTSLAIPRETRIYNGCENATINNEFGSQKISTAQESFSKWSEPGFEIEFQNKYIFSGKYEEGKVFYVFSKPLDFPFKVSDLIFLTSSDKKYCFLNAPSEIRGEITRLKQENFLINCGDNETAVRVCFDSNTNAGCDMNVRYNLGYVEKNSGRLYFETDALMYGAIFADKEVYECQARRLMKRAESLGGIYQKKADFIELKDCNSNIDFNSYLVSLRNYKDSSNLNSLNLNVNMMKQDNERASCRLW